MDWSMDRQGIRTLFDRETRRLKQFELSGPRRGRISLDTYPDELTARDAEFRQEARYGKWSEPARSHTVCALITSAFLDFSVQDGAPADVVGMKKKVEDEDYKQATALAALAAPYRQARLSAVKLAGDPNNPVPIADEPSRLTARCSEGCIGIGRAPPMLMQ